MAALIAIVRFPAVVTKHALEARQDTDCVHRLMVPLHMGR
jgi:hypothetical protein